MTCSGQWSIELNPPLVCFLAHMRSPGHRKWSNPDSQTSYSSYSNSVMSQSISQVYRNPQTEKVRLGKHCMWMCERLSVTHNAITIKNNDCSQTGFPKQFHLFKESNKLNTHTHKYLYTISKCTTYPHRRQ